MKVDWKAISAYFTLYSKSVFSEIPAFIYFLLLLITTVGIVYIFTNKKVESPGRSLGRLALLEYVAFILCLTVFCRECLENRAINLTPFWHYAAESADLQHSLYVEGLMNVLMFVPVGLLLGCAFNDIGWKRMLVVALCLSVSIEVLQFILQKGFAELDDVMHNVLGAALGFGIYCMCAWIWRKIVGIKKC